MTKSLAMSLYLTFILIFPVFGGAFGEQHVLLFVISVCLFWLSRNTVSLDNSSCFFVCCLLFLQFSLLASWALDIISGIARYNDLLSLLRPLGLIVMFIGFTMQFRVLKLNETVDIFIINVVVALLCLALLNKLSPEIAGILYFESHRFRDSPFISVFATTYFAAFFYFIIFSYSLSKLACRIDLKKWVPIFILSICFIFFSQGKNAYTAALVATLFIFIALTRPIISITGLVVTVASLPLLGLRLDSVIGFLKEADYFSLHQLSLYLEYGHRFGSVESRLEQIYNAYDGSLSNNLFGVGLGRDILLESYISSYLYRYGILGFILYSCLYIILFIVSFLGYKRSSGNVAQLFLFCSLFFLNLPILMLSSPMFEMGKNSIYSVIIVVLLFETIRRNKIKRPQI